MTTITNADYTWYTWTKGPRGPFRSEAEARAAWRRFDARCAARDGSGARTHRPGNRLYACRTRALARGVCSAYDGPGAVIVCEA